MAIAAAKKDVDETGELAVPLHLRNAPTKFMKNLDYGKEYKYTPSFENPNDSKQEYFPDRLRDRKYLLFQDN